MLVHVSTDEREKAMIKSDVLVTEARVAAWDDHGYTGKDPFMDSVIDIAVKSLRERIGPETADVEAVYTEGEGLDSLTIVVAPVSPPRDPESPWPLVHVTHDGETDMWDVDPYPASSGTVSSVPALDDAMHLAAYTVEAQIACYGLDRP